MSDEYLRNEAIKQLEGVGDESRGVIPDEREQLSYQVRRRLSVEEQALVGEACDIRGTREAQERLQRGLRWLPPVFHAFARDEVRSSLPQALASNESMKVESWE